MKKNNKGFTLIELLAVILILGIIDGKSMIAVLYGICFVCSVISFIQNVAQIKKENDK